MPPQQDPFLMQLLNLPSLGLWKHPQQFFKAADEPCVLSLIILCIEPAEYSRVSLCCEDFLT